jgi:hypothetical protein
MFISKNVQNKNCLNLKIVQILKSSNKKCSNLIRSNSKKFKFWKVQKNQSAKPKTGEKKPAEPN